MPKLRLSCLDCLFCQAPIRAGKIICWRPYEGPEIVECGGGLCGYEVLRDDEDLEECYRRMSPGHTWCWQHDRSEAALRQMFPRMRRLAAELDREETAGRRAELEGGRG